MMKKVIIAPDAFDRSAWVEAEVEDVCAYIKEQFKELPERTKIYHQHIADECEVTPRNPQGVARLQSLQGTIYVVIKPDFWIAAFWIVTALMAAYSVYAILTMPKPPSASSGSANNELANRSNQARLNGRIPDIFGMLRSYADLIAQTFTFYNSEGVEVEESLMCIGRGYYQILDCKDVDTDVEGIDGVSVSIFDPNKPIIGTDTIYRVGQVFDYAPLAVRKSGSINGQTLVKPNDVKIESQSIYFQSGGIIKSTDTLVDFTKAFKVGDGIVILGAQFGVQDFNLSGNAVVTQLGQVIIRSNENIQAFDNYKGIKLTGASFEVIDETSGGSDTSFRDLSGQYEVAKITRTQDSGTYTYTVDLVTPRRVNYNWTHVSSDHTVSAGIELNFNTESINLDDTYSIGAITKDTINLTNAATVNPEWTKLARLENGSTQGQASNIELQIVASKWIGWFDIDFKDATHAHFNLYFSNGLYRSTSKGGTSWASATIGVEYQMIDDQGNALTPIQTHDIYFEDTRRGSFGKTITIDLIQKGNVRFRIAKIAERDADNVVADCKIKDVFLSYESGKTTYPDVTVIRSLTVATDGALSLKERKLNCLVNRKLPKDGTGELEVTRSAAQALIYCALDQSIGRRSINEVDIAQINAEIEKVNQYFGSDIMSEFNYTIDDDNLSFEEIAGMIASAAFCEPHRFGSLLRLKFEQPQDNSVLLFNHRNKVPSTEKRTYTFGVQKDYDGVELEYTSDIDDARIKYIIPEDSTPNNPLKITTTGIRNEAQAKVRAWREWNKLKYKYVSAEFEALDESELLIRNDRILIANNTVVSAQDGEVVDVNGLTIFTSQPCKFDANTLYYVYLQLPDASVDMIQCSRGDDEYSLVLSRAPLKPLVFELDRYAKTTYAVLKAEDRPRQAFMLEELTPQTQMSNTLRASNYDARFYERDHDFI